MSDTPRTEPVRLAWVAEDYDGPLKARPIVDASDYAALERENAALAEALLKLRDAVCTANREVGMDWGAQFGAIVGALAVANALLASRTAG